jgi:hypothetical protein
MVLQFLFALKNNIQWSGLCGRNPSNTFSIIWDRSVYEWITKQTNNKQTPWSESASELYRPSDHRLSAKLVLTFADRGCHVVSVTDTSGRILEFLDRSRCFFFQAAPQLYSRGQVDPVPGPLLLRKSGRAGNRTSASGSVARNSDH